MKRLYLQIMKFGIVGIIATLIDVGVLTVLKEVFHVDVLVSSAIGYSLSTIVNYLLSIRFVFQGTGKSRRKEFAFFVLLSLGGLCINQGLLWLGVAGLHLHYLGAKIAALLIVTAYNFVTRKLWLER